eukprot:scaffold328904_cov67-Tisochrysis_lutea.AAC.1
MPCPLRAASMRVRGALNQSCRCPQECVRSTAPHAASQLARHVVSGLIEETCNPRQSATTPRS